MARCWATPCTPGVPLRYLLEDAGMDPEAGALTFLAPDGFVESVQMDNYTEAYLCYQIDGEPLPWKQGYPVQIVVPNSGAPASVKQVSDIVVVSKEEATELHEWNGWPRETEGTAYYTPGNWPYDDSNGYQNKPTSACSISKRGRSSKPASPTPSPATPPLGTSRSPAWNSPWTAASRGRASTPPT